MRGSKCQSTGLVPLRGKKNCSDHVHKRIMVHFRGSFQNSRRSPPSLLYGSTPRGLTDPGTNLEGKLFRSSPANLVDSSLLHFILFMFHMP